MMNHRPWHAALRPALTLAVLSLTAACGDDDATPTDTTQADTSVADTTEADTAEADMVQADTSEADTAQADTADDTTAVPDTSSTSLVVSNDTCFDLSEATVDLPFAIPESFTAASPTFTAPEACPAETLSDTATPYVAYRYCNGGTETTDYLFEMLADGDDDSAVIVAYSGDDAPADIAACLGVDSPLLGLAEVAISIAPGESVVIVATSLETTLFNFTLVSGPFE